MQANPESAKKILEGMHLGLLPLFPPRDRNVLSGALIGFMTAAFVITSELLKKYPNTAFNTSLEGKVAELRKSGKLGVDAAFHEKSPEDVLRHIRNCFAHAQWILDESEIQGKSWPLRILDFNPKTKTQTFGSVIDIMALATLAEEIVKLTKSTDWS